MNRINGTELKMLELNILQVVHDFCVRHEITYYLCGGTLLGAVRHGGFIPWDDDIDIYMPRDDYERFIGLFTSVSGFKVLDFQHSAGYYLPFAKVCDDRTVVKETLVEDVPECGVYIDVFPLDGLSNDFKIAKKVLMRNAFYMKINSVLSLKKSKVKDCKSAVKRIMQVMLPQKLVVQTIVRNARRYKYKESDFVGVAFGFYGVREVLSKEIFASRVEIKFEGRSFYAPVGTDQYLTALYGDYMQPPPLEKQVTHHSFVPYWKV